MDTSPNETQTVPGAHPEPIGQPEASRPKPKRRRRKEPLVGRIPRGLSSHGGEAGVAYRRAVLSLLGRVGLDPETLNPDLVPLVVDFGRSAVDLEDAIRFLEECRTSGTQAAKAEARRQVYTIRSSMLNLENRLAGYASRNPAPEPEKPKRDTGPYAPAYDEEK